MATPYNRDLLTEAQDRLLDLFVQDDEAKRAQDWQRVSALKSQIEAASYRRDELRGSGNRRRQIGIATD